MRHAAQGYEKMIDYVFLLQMAINGLILGLIYALIASGLTILFGVLQIVNFAHGEFVMIGAYAMYIALPLFGLSYAPSLIIAVAASALFAVLIFELFLSRVAPGEFERGILVTMGISMVLIHGVQYVMTASPRMVDTEFGFAGISVGDIRVTWVRAIAAAIALAAFAGLYFCLNRTDFGRTIRAVAQNRDAALMVGIKPRNIARNAVILAGTLCGLAGAAIAPFQMVLPTMGMFLVFKAFAIVLIGGFGNVQGAILAGICLGVLESFVGGFFSIVWQEAVGFIIMILVLLVRPEGLFARAGVRVG